MKGGGNRANPGNHEGCSGLFPRGYRADIFEELASTHFHGLLLRRSGCSPEDLFEFFLRPVRGTRMDDNGFSLAKHVFAVPAAFLHPSPASERALESQCERVYPINLEHVVSISCTIQRDEIMSKIQELEEIERKVKTQVLNDALRSVIIIYRARVLIIIVFLLVCMCIHVYLFLLRLSLRFLVIPIYTYKT